MWWEEFTWKADVFISKVDFRAIAIVLAVVLYISAPFLAPLAFGPRGDLLGLALQWLAALSVSGVIAVLCGLLFRASQSFWKWAGLAGLILFGGIFLYAALEAVLSSADAVLPFKEREVTVVRTYYEHPQTGRGAMPETGGWHILTAAGDDYRVRDSGDGDKVRQGRNRLELSYLKHLVMAEKPVSD